MPFFNTEIANLLQHIAVPMETAGLVLTVIEVWWPTRARATEIWLQNFGTAPTKSMWATIHTKVAGGPNGYVTPAMIVHGLVAAAGATWVGYKEDSWGFGIMAYVPLGLLLYVIEFIVLVITSRFLWPFSALTRNRALGGFGIALGMIGLAMEIYQVITIHVTSST